MKKREISRSKTESDEKEQRTENIPASVNPFYFFLWFIKFIKLRLFTLGHSEARCMVVSTFKKHKGKMFTNNLRILIIF